MTLIAALVLVPGLAGIIYYLRRIAQALEAAPEDEGPAPAAQATGLGGGGRR